jgi:hypothetical protein
MFSLSGDRSPYVYGIPVPPSPGAVDVDDVAAHYRDPKEEPCSQFDVPELWIVKSKFIITQLSSQLTQCSRGTRDIRGCSCWGLYAFELSILLCNRCERPLTKRLDGDQEPAENSTGGVTASHDEPPANIKATKVEREVRNSNLCYEFWNLI